MFALKRLSSYAGLQGTVRISKQLCDHLHTSAIQLGVNTIPLHTGRPTLVILGTGWAAARLVHDINPSLYDLAVIAPRNHVRRMLR